MTDLGQFEINPSILGDDRGRFESISFIQVIKMVDTQILLASICTKLAWASNNLDIMLYFF
jgi:hypothetical protein